MENRSQVSWIVPLMTKHSPGDTSVMFSTVWTTSVEELLSRLIEPGDDASW